jgi:hypothetical protein
MQGVVIARNVSITGPHNKKYPWLPRALSCIDGEEYVTLDERESGFRRFVHGEAVWRMSTFLEDLLKMRNDACKAARDGQQTLFTASDDDKSKYRKRMERQRAKATDKELEGSVIVLKVADDVNVGGRNIKVLFAASPTQKLQVELEPDVLLYVAERCRASIAAPKPKKRAAFECPSRGVYWHKTRVGWVWKDETKYRICKVPRTAVGDEFETAVESARERAVAKASGADEGGSQCDDDDVMAEEAVGVSDAEGVGDDGMQGEGGESEGDGCCSPRADAA